MQVILLKPYDPLPKGEYSDTTLSIDIGMFANVRPESGKITFVVSECNFKSLIVRNRDKIPFDNISIAFFGCIIKNLEVKEVETENLDMGFYGCMLEGRISAPKLTGIEVSNSIITNGLFLLKQRNVRVNYSDNNLHPIVWRRMMKKVGITFNELITKKQSFHIHDPESITFAISKNQNTKPGLLKLPFGLKDNKYTYVLSIGEWGKVDLNLHIKFNKNIDNQKVVISKAQLHSLTLSGRTEASISIEESHIDNMYLYEFSPKGQTSFYGINPLAKNETKIGIHKCNLDDVSFDNVRFDQYSRISLYRSKLAKAVFTSCDFPDTYSSFERFLPIDNVHYPDRRTLSHHKDQYEIFLQLKQALEATGNYYEAQKLQSISHEALKRVPSIANDDKTILEVNSFSNNHGISISRPFWWFICVSIGFYLLYLLSLGRLFTDSEFDSTLVGYYFSFIDITHRTDFLVDKTEYNGWSLAIDSLAKLIMGFFIYQFIAAFRKYGKK